MYATWNRLSKCTFLIYYKFLYNCNGKQTKTQNLLKMEVLTQTAYLRVVSHAKHGKRYLRLNESDRKKAPQSSKWEITMEVSLFRAKSPAPPETPCSPPSQAQRFCCYSATGSTRTLGRRGKRIDSVPTEFYTGPSDVINNFPSIRKLQSFPKSTHNHSQWFFSALGTVSAVIRT